MRWLFVLLLALNLAYIGWELSQYADKGRSTERSGSSKDVASIVLLRELQSAEKDAAEVTADTPAVAEPPMAASVSEPVPEAVEKTPEVAVAEPTVVASKATQAEQSPVQHTAAACYTVGPFREIGNLRKLIRDLRDYVAEASFRSSEEREQSMYWVYLAPQRNKEAADALGDELKRKSIRDYYVINSGEQLNAISLGHFREKERALSLLQKVEKAGFSPLIEPVFKTYTIYWLDYRLHANKAIPVTILDLSSLPKVSRYDRACE